MKNFNILKDIRERNGYSMEEFAKLLGITRTALYQVEIQTPIKHKYLEKIKHLLTEEDIKKNNNASLILNSILNSNQSNCINYNNTTTIHNQIQIPFYQNLFDLSKQQNQIQKQYDVDTLKIITNNKLIQDYSKLIFCKHNNKTLIIDTANIAPTDKYELFVIQNVIDNNNSTCFIASVKINVLNNKIVMTLENSNQEIEMLNSCRIFGRIILTINEC